MKVLITIFSFFMILGNAVAQDTTGQKTNSWTERMSQWDASKDLTDNYEWRIRQTRLEGVYIPKDLKDAMRRLTRLTTEESRQKFMSLPEGEAVKKLHFSFGRWVSLNWSFYRGSRFSKYLKDMGLTYPDDMSTFTLSVFHRDLLGQEWEVFPLIEQILEKRRKEREEKFEHKKREVIKRYKKDTTTNKKQ